MRPLTSELPKPLLPLGDRPVLAHLIERLRGSGMTEGVVNTHHLPEKIIEFARGCDFFLHVEEEAEIRGTAGGVCGARRHLGPAPVLVSNADLIFDVPAPALLEKARACGTMVFAVAKRRVGEGAVGLGSGDRIVRLRGERFGEEVSGADYLGVMALGAQVLERLPQRGCLVGEVALPLLRQNVPLFTAEVTSPFWSLGDSIADYLDANLSWLCSRGERSFVGQGAVIGEGVSLLDSVVGAGALVSGQGAVERSVIWPGAQVRAPLADAVVTSSGVIVERK